MDSTGDSLSLEEVLIGGIEKRAIRIVDYDAAWPARFESEQRRLRVALGSTVRRIEHVGSTAVPGLPAKPIVDILVTVDDVEIEDDYRVPLEEAGYVLRVREPGHRMFRTPELDVHVHISPANGEDERRLIAFRDRLRVSAEDRALYAERKRELARRDWAHTDEYALAKGPLIEEILRRAGQ